MKKERFFTLETEAKNIFIQIPKIFMVEESNYFKISPLAKLLYGVLYDRNSLSIKNGWVDDDGKVYFLFNQENLAKTLGIKSPKTVRNYLKELEFMELLYRERQGLQKPDKLYLLQVEVPESQSYKLMGKNYPSRQVKNTHHDRNFLPTNNTDINNNKTINNEKIREGEPSFPDLSHEESNIISLDGKKKSLQEPAVIPDEDINQLDKYVVGRFKKERAFYGTNFNEGLYYNSFANAVVKTQLQDNVEIITMTQYPYFIATLKKMIEPLELEEKLLGWK